METLNIALLQLLPKNTLEERRQQGIEACRRAKEMGADIALFPEMWSSGYNIPKDIPLLKSLVQGAQSPFVQSFGELARELEMAIAVTFLEAWEPLPRNTMVLFDRRGLPVLTYAKVHTCDFGEECRLTPGEGFFTTELDTAKGSVAVGAMICYDREFPESARLLMLQGAEVVLVPNACPMELNRLSQLRGRAYENMIAIATCNYPQGQPDCNGHSTVFDGVAYLPEEEASRDTCILDAGAQPGIYLAKLNLKQLRKYRREEVHGNAYRRPEKYHALVSQEVQEPFIRPDKRK